MALSKDDPEHEYKIINLKAHSRVQTSAKLQQLFNLQMLYHSPLLTSTAERTRTLFEPGILLEQAFPSLKVFNLGLNLLMLPIQTQILFSIFKMKKIIMYIYIMHNTYPSVQVMLYSPLCCFEFLFPTVFSLQYSCFFLFFLLLIKSRLTLN